MRALMQKHQLPCLRCQPTTYIRMVQHLIERCLLLQMNPDDCAAALAHHANIQPLVTLTVWKELEKENRGFFRAYFEALSSRPSPYKQIRRTMAIYGGRRPRKF